MKQPIIPKPLLSIGQMIEFLEKQCRFIEITYYWKKGNQNDWKINLSHRGVNFSNNLCDVLRQAVKEILEK